MKKFVFALPALLASAAIADIGVVEATGAFQLAGASSTSYVSAIGAGSNPRINGYDFGPVNVLTGQTLLLQNWYFENYAYNGGSTPSGAATNDNWLDGNNVASLVVTIKSGGTTVSSNTYSLYQTGNSGSNRFWQLSVGSQNTNLANGLSNGSYTVEFTSTYNANQWTGFVSQFNATTATSTASLVVTIKSGGTTVSSNTYSLYQTGNSGSNRFWQLSAGSQNTNLANGLSNGAYTVEFTSTFNANQWTGSVSQFNATTATSTASFTVIPAPGAVALVGLAGIIAKRRKA